MSVCFLGLYLPTYVANNYHAVALLGNEKVLFVGGQNWVTGLDHGEMYVVNAYEVTLETMGTLGVDAGYVGF